MMQMHDLIAIANFLIVVLYMDWYYKINMFYYTAVCAVLL